MDGLCNRVGLSEIYQYWILHANQSLFSVSILRPPNRPKQPGGSRDVHCTYVRMGEQLEGILSSFQKESTPSPCHASQRHRSLDGGRCWYQNSTGLISATLALRHRACSIIYFAWPGKMTNSVLEGLGHSCFSESKQPSQKPSLNFDFISLPSKH